MIFADPPDLSRQPPAARQVRPPRRSTIGHRSATVCHLGNLAIRSGRKVTWDPAKEEVVGDPEQARMVHYPYREPWKLTVSGV